MGTTTERRAVDSLVSVSGRITIDSSPALGRARTEDPTRIEVLLEVKAGTPLKVQSERSLPLKLLPVA